jgi:threonylcarbamoyladenosine tRNA methylthiotransferase MtaB
MTVAFYTLGCKVNLYETEVVINIFKNNGYKIVPFNEKADIYIINTCTVTNTSDQKSRKMIRQAIKRNKDAIIVVMGCYSQLKSNELNKLDDVDIIIGNKDKTKILEYIENILDEKEKIVDIYDINKVEFEDMTIDNFLNHTRAFVKIQDGCNNYCSYCIIPYARGNVRSKDKNKVITEVTSLVNNGYKEVVLTGIHTGHYGADLTNYDFADLLNDIIKINGLKRIRISSIEITEINDKVLNILKSSNVIADHLHIPLQSGNDKILKLMNRKYDTNYYLNKIEEIRSIRPDIAITSDVIVGFPDETEEDFNDTYNFIKKINLSALHIFPYSKREGTKAASMPNQIDNNIRKKRVVELMALSKELELNYMNKFINKVLEIIPEEYIDGYIIGHSSNYLKIKANDEEIKDIVRVKINKIEYPYCIGEIVE